MWTEDYDGVGNKTYFASSGIFYLLVQTLMESKYMITVLSAMGGVLVNSIENHATVEQAKRAAVEMFNGMTTELEKLTGEDE